MKNEIREQMSKINVVNVIAPVCLFYFLLPISRESIVLVSKFQNEDFDEFTRFEILLI